MPVHNWKIVDAGIFHDFHHAWIEEIKRSLNAGILPNDYYALAEQHAAGFGPDVLTLQTGNLHAGGEWNTPDSNGSTAVLLAEPRIQVTAETDLEFYLRKQSAIAVRHVSGDELIAVVEIVSRGNKSSRGAAEAFIEKAAKFLSQGIHLLIVDVHAPGPRDPQGFHALIWEHVSGQQSRPPTKPLTLAAYEAGAGLRAYVETVSIGDQLTEMPLFLMPRRCVHVPLEETYQRSFAALPRRWQSVLDKPA